MLYLYNIYIIYQTNGQTIHTKSGNESLSSFCIKSKYLNLLNFYRKYICNNYVFSIFYFSPNLGSLKGVEYGYAIGVHHGHGYSYQTRTGFDILGELRKS